MKISQCRNLGPKTEEQFEAMGVHNFEQLEAMGWEEVITIYSSYYPDLMNLNLVYAVIGAIYDQDWRNIDPQLKKQARQFIAKVKKLP